MTLPRVLACFVLASVLAVASAQQCTWEIEPNDTPATATLITGEGPDSATPPGQGRLPTACLAGTLSGNDQDAFIWEVDEKGADQHWVIDLEGAPGALTRLDLMRVTFADNQVDVTAREDLLTVATSTGRMVTSEGFLLEPGRYLIGASIAGGSGDYVAFLRPTAALSYRSRTPRTDRAWSGEFSITGAAPEGLSQAWSVSEEDAGYVWSVTLEAALGASPELVVSGADGVMARVRSDATGYARLSNLGLTAGEYDLRIEGGTGVYRLTTTRDGRKSDGLALEPNDSFETATRFDLGTQMRGSILRVDYFRIDVDEDAAATAWALDLEADAPLVLTLYTEDGSQLLRRHGRAISLDGLVLRPGAYQLQLDGPDGTAYALTWRADTPPASGWEAEPNDARVTATPLGEDGQVRGHLGPDDVDVFALEVSGEAQLYRLQVIGPGALDLSVLDGGGREFAGTRGAQRLRLDNLLLLTGTHHVRLSGEEGEYALRVLPLGPPPAPVAPEDLPDPHEPLTAAPAALEEQTPAEAAASPAAAPLPPLPPPPPGQLELEPNDEQTRADLLTPGVPRVGTLPSDSDTDYYRFHLAHDQPVRIELVPPEGGQPIPFRLSATGWVEPAWNAPPGTRAVTEQWLLAGDHYIEVRRASTGSGYYQLRLTQLNAALLWDDEAAGDGELADAGVSVTLASPVTDLAAYWGQGQSVTATARISNEGSEPQDVDLTAGTTDARVALELPARVRLEPGASAEVPVRVTVPADLRDDLPLRISLAATTAQGSSGASLAFAASCEAVPVDPVAYWPVPAPLLGGIDLLWSGLGAGVHGAASPQPRDLALIDGRVTPSYGGWVSEDEPAIYQLAGDAPAELVGALLHPLTQANVNDQLKRFRIETSLDGGSFSTVYEGELLAARIEQAIVFEKPVLARYARLVGLGDQRDRRGGYVGEFKLIAKEPAPFGSLDLADPALGGHVVWSEPHTGNAFLRPDERPRTVDLREYDAFTFVVGFHNGRAAQITRLEWADSPEAVGNAEAFSATVVEVSLTGAAGPWQPLAEWELARDASGRAVLELPAPVWARYLRFTSAKTGEQRNWAVPVDLVVEERGADRDYASALGEWGMGARSGVYEYLQPPAAPTTPESDADNDTLQAATPLASGAAVEGTVLVGEDVDWYRLTIEPGHNHLEVRLSGEPAIDYEYALVDGAGAPVAYDLRNDGDAVVLSLFGDPGDYFLKLEEPKRTVVFSWDTSGSMGPYLEITYNALATFAAGVDGTREAVQLLAFDWPAPRWLLPLWTGDTERVQRTVNEFDRRADSSNSEPALLTATRALAERDGTRGLLLITDAETGSYDLTTEVWRALEEVRPRIFTFEVSSGGSLRAQQLMQGWAGVNSGHYALAATIGDLDAGYSRASCILRRPKHYRVEVTSSAAEPPGPGSLRVTRPADAPEAAVEVIFDASGSMGVPLPSGEQRITAAKRVLESLVTEVLPEGAAFALRAFGHVEPMTCNTRLELPLGPLERTKALAAVRAIEPKLLSQTPLGESLTQVGNDLARAGSSRTVILITDGVESCGADPVEAVRELRRQHPVNLVIVSLGLAPEERASFEALAAATDASYVDVSSFEELKASVDGALHARFEVIGDDGAVVASGMVDGEAVELPMGVYTVRVHGAPPREYPNVRVPGESSVTVTHGGR